MALLCTLPCKLGVRTAENGSGACSIWQWTKARGGDALLRAVRLSMNAESRDVQVRLVTYLRVPYLRNAWPWTSGGVGEKWGAPDMQKGRQQRVCCTRMPACIVTPEYCSLSLIILFPRPTCVLTCVQRAHLGCITRRSAPRLNP